MEIPVKRLSEGRLHILDRYRSEYADFGFAISSFSSLEFGLLLVYVKVSPLNERDAIDSFWQITSVQGRFDFIKARMKERAQGDPLRLAWHEIEAKIQSAISRRNELAHGEFTPIILAAGREQVGFWVRLAKTSSSGLLKYDPANQIIVGTNFFTAEQLIEFAREFIDLSESLAAMIHRRPLV